MAQHGTTTAQKSFMNFLTCPSCPLPNLDRASNEAWEAESVVAPAPNWSGPIEIIEQGSGEQAKDPKMSKVGTVYEQAARVLYGRDETGGFFFTLWQNTGTFQVFRHALSLKPAFFSQKFK